MRSIVNIILFFVFLLILSSGYSQLHTDTDSDYFTIYDSLIENTESLPSNTQNFNHAQSLHKAILPVGAYVSEIATSPCRTLSSNKRYSFDYLIAPIDTLSVNNHHINPCELYPYFPHAKHVDFYIFTLLRIRI